MALGDRIATNLVSEEQGQRIMLEQEMATLQAELADLLSPPGTRSKSSRTPWPNYKHSWLRSWQPWMKAKNSSA
ncbi:MAG: hypothetical protein R2856_33095 [Caldilineaceae bacterium]